MLSKKIVVNARDVNRSKYAIPRVVSYVGASFTIMPASRTIGFVVSHLPKQPLQYSCLSQV